MIRTYRKLPSGAVVITLTSGVEVRVSADELTDREPLHYRDELVILVIKRIAAAEKRAAPKKRASRKR